MHEKPYFLFLNVPKRCFSQKNNTGIWSFWYHQERWYFFSPKIWYYSLGRKWKDLSQKKYTELWYILQTFWKDGLSKKNYTEIWSFSYHEERWNFFFPKIYLFTDGKWKMILLKKYMEMWYFMYVGKGGISLSNNPQIWNYPSVKKAKMIFSRKIHLQMTFPALLKKMIFILEKMILAFSVLLWRPF